MKNLKLSYLTFFIVPIVFGCNHVKDPIWTISLKGDGLPPKVEYADTSVIIVSYIDSLYCLDNKTGKTLFTSESEYFSNVYFDDYLYFFKDDDLFIKVNPYNPKKKWELKLKKSFFHKKSIFKRANKIYLLGYSNVWEVDADSLQIIDEYNYSKNLDLLNLNIERIYADDKNVFYTSNKKLCIYSYIDSDETVLLDSLSIYNEFIIKRNENTGYYILDHDFHGPMKIYKLGSDKKLKKIHEDIQTLLFPIKGFSNNNIIAYEAGKNIIVYSLKNESVLLKYPFKRRVGDVIVHEDILLIHEIKDGNDHNRSRIHFVDIKTGDRIHKIKFDQLVRDFAVAGNKIYYSMDNRISCSEI